MRSTLCAFTALGLLSSHAFAQAPAASGAPFRVAGAVQSVSGDKMTVLSEKGETIEVVIAAGTPLARMVDASRTELAAAKLANCTATGASGSLLQATECSVIPADTKMVNSGHFPNPSGTSRTVGNVASVKGDPSKDLELVISYKDGQQRIAVPLSAKIGKSAPTNLSQVKPGDHVVAAARSNEGKTSVITMIVTPK